MSSRYLPLTLISRVLFIQYCQSHVIFLSFLFSVVFLSFSSNVINICSFSTVKVTLFTVQHQNHPYIFLFFLVSIVFSSFSSNAIRKCSFNTVKITLFSVQRQNQPFYFHFLSIFINISIASSVITSAHQTVRITPVNITFIIFPSSLCYFPECSFRFLKCYRGT